MISHDEFVVYDLVKTMSFFAFLASLLVAFIGKCGLRTVWMNHSAVTGRVLKKQKWIVGFLVLIMLGVAHNGAQIKKIKHENKERRHQEKESQYLDLFKDSEQCDADHSAQDECDLDAACTWCVSAAVRSKCFSVEDAAKLPSSIFSCDAKVEEEPVIASAPVQDEKEYDMATFMRAIGETSDECDASHSSQSSCDADSECTWCTSAAVRSKCFNAEDATKLPSAVFHCDAKVEEAKPSLAAPVKPVEEKTWSMREIKAILKETSDECDANHSSQDSCDADSQCTWCVSAAVRSKCFAVDDAEKLPSAVFHCDAKAEEEQVAEEEKEDFDMETFVDAIYGETSDECDANHSSQSSCDSDSECTWCVSAAVRSKCFNALDAAKLPSAVFTCDAKSKKEMKKLEKKPVVAHVHNHQYHETLRSLGFEKTSDECDADYSSQGSCDADSDCTWCVSAAVRSKCFNVEDAAKLPSAVFQCDSKIEENVFGESFSEEPEHHGKHNGKHHGRHHHKRCHEAAGPLVLGAILIAHFCYLKSYQSAQLAHAKVHGEREDPCPWAKKCGAWKKKTEAAPSPVVQQPEASSSPVLEYSICESLGNSPRSEGDTQSVPRVATNLV